PGEDRRHRREVDVAEGEVTAGGDVVELVAVPAVTAVGGQGDDDLGGHDDGKSRSRRQARTCPARGRSSGRAHWASSAAESMSITVRRATSSSIIFESRSPKRCRAK